MKKWLFNPFRYIAGWTAFFWGWGIMLLTAVVAYYSETHFDGAIDAHTGASFPFWLSLAEPLIDWGSVVLFFAIGGWLITTRFRLIDLAGTAALARAPLVFCAVIGFVIPPFTGIKNIGPATILLGLPEAGFSIWMIALLYQGFTISCNIKGGKAVAAFIIALIFAEAFSHYLLYLAHAYFTH
jgi:hypothetical protein